MKTPAIGLSEVLVTIVGGLLLTGVFYTAIELPSQKKEDALRHEIAVNFATKWHQCDVAERWDSTVPCSR